MIAIGIPFLSLATIKRKMEKTCNDVPTTIIPSL